MPEDMIQHHFLGLNNEKQWNKENESNASRHVSSAIVNESIIRNNKIKKRKVMLADMYPAPFSTSP